jgi:hypothetical protein
MIRIASAVAGYCVFQRRRKYFCLQNPLHMYVTGGVAIFLNFHFCRSLPGKIMNAFLHGIIDKSSSKKY